MTTMVKRALDRMLHPRPIGNTPSVPISRIEGGRAMADEIARLRARIAELERERDGLLDLIL